MQKVPQAKKTGLQIQDCDKFILQNKIENKRSLVKTWNFVVKTTPTNIFGFESALSISNLLHAHKEPIVAMHFS